MRLPKAILFDLDDTIVAYDRDAAKIWDTACEEFIGRVQPNFSLQRLRGEIDEVSDWYWHDPELNRIWRNHLEEARRQITQIALQGLGLADLELANELADRYSVLRVEQLAIFDGAVAALERLAGLKIRLGIITNGASAKQRAKIDRYHLAPFFELILIDTEVGFSKPDRAIYELALQRLDLPAEQVWMVGDNLVWDVAGAQQMGIFAVWNDYLGRGLPENAAAQPDMIVSSIDELSQIVGKYAILEDNPAKEVRV